MTPDVAKLLAGVKGVFPYFSELEFIREVETEEAGVVVGAVGVITVFATRVITEFPPVVSKALEESLKIVLSKGAVLGKTFVVVGECNEGVIVVELCLVSAANRPLAGFF